MADTPDNIVPITGEDDKEAAKQFIEQNGRELVTILFTDLVDSTQMQSDLGNEESARITVLHRELVREELNRYEAREIEWAGDSCLAVFTKPSDAVVFALRMQAEHRVVRKKEKNLPKVRVGIHLGEIVIQKDGAKDDLFGLQVSETARVMSIARGDQVFCTRAVYDSARGSLKGQKIEGVGDAIWVSYGHFLLKGSDDPVEVCEIGSAEVAVMKAPEANDKVVPVGSGMVSSAKSPGAPKWAFGLAALLVVVIAMLLYGNLSGLSGGSFSKPQEVFVDLEAPIRSLAVLPLENRMNDPEQEYFVDGMTEAITAELSQIASLTVISRTSAMQYKNSKLGAKEIAGRLGVTGLIEGSVTKQGDEVRIQVSLTDGRTAESISLGAHDGTLSNIFELHGKVALAIANQVEATITPDEEGRITAPRNVDKDAYDYFLKGNAAGAVLTTESMNNAIKLFQLAQSEDDTFADAISREAYVHFLMGGFGFANPKSKFELAHKLYSDALKINPDDSVANGGLGLTELMLNRNWDRALNHIEKAVDVAPNSPAAHTNMGFYHAAAGNIEGARSSAYTILELAPEASVFRVQAADLLRQSGLPNEALRILDEILTEQPKNVYAMTIREYVYENRGMIEEDKAQWAELENFEAAQPWNKAYSLVLEGDEAGARALLEELRNNPDDVDGLVTGLACASIFVGDLDASFYWWERSASEKEIDLVLFLRGMSVTHENRPELRDKLAAFYGDPRFWDLIEKYDFPPLQPGHPLYKEDYEWRMKRAAEKALEAQPKPVRMFEVASGKGLADPIISPDGRMIAYTRDQLLFVHDLEQLKTLDFPDIAGADDLFWSPDSENVGYTRDGALWRLSVVDGVTTKICNLEGGFSFLGGAWGSDQNIVFGRNRLGLFKVPSIGGPAIRYRIHSELGDVRDFHNPRFLPDGDTLVTMVHPQNRLPYYLGSVVDGNLKPLFMLSGRNIGNPVYSPSGHLLFSQGNYDSEIWAVPMSLANNAAGGEPFLVAKNVSDASVAADGTLVNLTGVEIQNSQLFWISRDGEIIEPIGRRQLRMRAPAISPDGERVAVTGADDDIKSRDIWVHTMRNIATPVTTNDIDQFYPEWHPTAGTIAYSEFGDTTMFTTRPDQSGEPTALNDDGASKSFSADGRYLVYTTSAKVSAQGPVARGLPAIWYMDNENANVPQMFQQSNAVELDPQIVSIAGGDYFVAYVSNVSGESEVYVSQFPSGRGRTQISTNGGTHPRWNGKGDELFFVNDNVLMAVKVGLGETIVVDTEEVLFTGEEVQATLEFFGNAMYDVTADGERFAVIRNETTGTPVIQVTQNWATGYLTKRDGN